MAFMSYHFKRARSISVNLYLPRFLFSENHHSITNNFNEKGFTHTKIDFDNQIDRNRPKERICSKQNDSLKTVGKKKKMYAIKEQRNTHPPPCVYSSYFVPMFLFLFGYFLACDKL